MPFSPRFLRVVVVASLSLFTLFWSGPVLWMAMLSLRTTAEFYRHPYALPVPAHFDKFVVAWLQFGFQTYFQNSVVLSVAADVLVVAIGAMAAFLFARYRFPLKEPLYLFIFAAILLPPQITLFGLFQLLVSYGLYGGLLGLIPIYAAANLPLTLYILRTFFAQIPQEIEEAAHIDGAGVWRMFWRVMLPITRPALLTVGILNFIEFWNEFLYAVVFITHQSQRTLPLGVMFFMGDHYEDIGMMATGLMITVLPVMILYAVFAERITESMTAGAVTG